MNEDRIEGTARNIGGKMEEGIGRATGDRQTEAEGIAHQVKGSAQNLYGQARDGAADVARATRQAGSSFEAFLRDTIEQQPYTAVGVALAIGWLLGRMHRPL